ncbi:MAG: hypothetical protein U5N21_18280 [Rhodococcus sp. (in: high G+C Gram-positive bacteria)]|nr:hypothetical protein [Rhodococcus sp. (in: high G+C Gram-positive bacteria)]
MNTPTPPPLDWTPPPFDLDRILDWLTFAAWTCAALSVLGALLGLVMLAFGSPRGPGAVVGGAVGTVVAVVIATTAVPYLHQALS